jgi:phosphoribosylaminoimidazole-succinocarboxamide synthase
MDGVADHHFLTEDLSGLPEPFQAHLDTLAGRSLVVKKADRFDVECVVRGYLAGSGWKEYRNGGTVCGLPLPAGLRESDRLPEPIFTPSTKEDDGHDQNIPFETMAEIVGGDVAEELRRLSLSIYSNLAAYCETRGIIVADTKFEFGRVGDRITLIDEVLTPDSSRFWPQDRYEPGRSQESFDKQYVRDWLENSGWNKLPPAPSLPEDVVKATASRYREAYERLVDPARPLRFTPETWR